MTSKYTEKVTVSLTKEDYAKLEAILANSRLSIGQLASTMVEDAIKAESVAPSKS